MKSTYKKYIPIDIQGSIEEDTDITIYFEKLPDSRHGYLIKKSNRYISELDLISELDPIIVKNYHMIINSTIPLVHQRWAMAKQLGNWFIYGPYMKLNQPTYKMKGVEKYEKHNRKVYNFASETIIPKKLIEYAYKQCQDEKELAEMFLVSPLLMKYRLHNLYLKDMKE